MHATGTVICSILNVNFFSSVGQISFFNTSMLCSMRTEFRELLSLPVDELMQWWHRHWAKASFWG